MYEREKLLVVARGVGGVGKVKISPEKSFVTNLSIIFNENENLVNYKYLYYYLSDRSLRELDTGSCQSQITVNQLQEKAVFIPNIEYQNKIASFLSDLDAKIELNNRINRELEAMAKTLYDYWFVQFDFPNEQGKPYKSSDGKMVYNAELKREIPEGWEVRELDFVLQEFTKGITTEYVEKSNLINLNQKVNKGFSLDRQYYKYLDERIEIPKGKYAKEKDILINSLGQGTLGRIHYFCEKTNNIVIDQHLFILRVDEDKITSSYLYLLLSSKPYEIQIERQITGSTGMQMLNGSNLKKFKVIVPNRDVLLGFESMVYPFYEKVVNNETQNQQLSELRDWLLPMLMNGQVTVSEL